MAAAKTGPQRPFSQEDIDHCLTALVAWSGNGTAAVRYLESEGRRTPHAATLNQWARTTHWERYQQIREQWSAQVEGTIAADMRDAARAAIEGAQLAVQKARKRLEDDKDEDPARTAANLSRVAQSSTDKLLSLTGRPSQITETRSNPEEILRGLVAKGILVAPVDADAEVELEEQPALAESAGDD